MNKKKSKKEEPTEPRKNGRPNTYDPKRHPEWVRGLAAHGMTVPQICEAMGITSATLYDWRDKYVEFSIGLSVGRSETVARLRNALYKRAEGFSVPTTKIETSGEDYQKVTKTETYFPPDVGAAKILLVNLDPAFKTERTEAEVTGKDGAPLIPAPKQMSDEDIIALIRKERDLK